MPVIDGVDLSLMREQIALLMETIPELDRINRYADGTNEVPGGELYFVNANRSPTDEQLGYNAYISTWRMNAFLANPGPTAKRDAQELFEVLVLRVHDAFDPLDLIHAVPIITTCSYDTADFSQVPLSDGTLYAIFGFSVTFLAQQPS